MAWVKQLLSGAEFVLETVNMLMFITEEACQMASMAMGTAMQNKNFNLAEEIADTTLGASNAQLWGIILIYAMMWIPSWSAFYCFYYSQSMSIPNLVDKLEGYKKLQA